MLILGDCIEEMKKLDDNSIDLCLTDPPYGTTACKWDNLIPFEPMWRELKRIVKDNGAICLFGSEPFSSALRMSNIKMFKYDWVWEKNQPTNYPNVKKQPMFNVEIVSIFYSNRCQYFPQGLKILNKMMSRGKHPESYGRVNIKDNGKRLCQFTNYPRQVLKYGVKGKRVHPTQKPVALLEYLIKTYTLENETVLDFTMGSGSTGVACKNLNREFIGIEKDEKYFNIAKKRINDACL